MTVIGEAFIAIRPTDKTFEQELSKQVVPAGQKVAKTLATAIGGAFVVKGLHNLAQQGIEELKEAAAVQAQTAAAIKSTGGAANVTAEHIEDLAGKQLKLTGVDDELIQKGENLLLTFTGVRNEVGKGNDIFDRATVAALDLSRAGFGSVESASVLLGKALNDPVNGLTALQRVGVRLTDDQKALVKQLVATGDTLGAQKVILEEVNRQVGGSAEAYGKTLPGQLAIAQESLDNTKGALLAGMAPALKLTAGATTALTEQFAKQPAALQSIEGGLLLVVGGLGSIITPLKSGIDLWRSFGTTAQTAATSAELAGAASAASAGQVAAVGGAATNSAAGFTNLYSSGGRARGVLQGITATGPAVVTTLGAIFGAVQLINDEADKASLPKLQRDLITLTQSGQVRGEALDLLGGDLKTLQNAIEDIAKPSVGAQAANVVSTMASLGTQHGVQGSLDKSNQLIQDLDDALTQLAQQDPDAAAAALTAIKESLSPQDASRLDKLLTGYSDQLASAEVQSKSAAEAIHGVGTASADAAGGADALAGATAEVGSETEATTEQLVGYQQKLDDARKAVDDLFDTTESAIDTEFRYRDAKDSTADALAHLTELQKDGKGKTDEYRRAIDDTSQTMFAQAQAAADNAEQQFKLAGKTLDAADKAAIQKRELERLRDTLAPNSPLRAQLQGMIDQLAKVPEAKKVKIDVITGQALVDIDRLARKIKDKLAGQGIHISVGGGGGLQLASGGRVPMYLASGGGPRGTDTIPAWLTPDEHVITAAAARRVGHDALDAINRGAGLGGVVFAAGSVVVNPPPGMSVSEARRLGGAFIEGAAAQIDARRLAVLGRVQ